ncbi:transposase [Streptococcus pneumoniae]|uniref:transposase n=1 Tax=Streptococcus pneumoniae TaxID=1313 RepID=UPI0005E0F96F|nr:transposase [Streptococcus pneumoniae]CMU62470.1 transposase [Streptococcus pneumoniae]
MNERYQNLKAKECQALLSPQGRQIFAQRKIDVEPVFGQLKACLGYKRCNLRGKRQVRIDMGLVLMANNLLKHSKIKREQDKLIRIVKSISNNVLEVEVYYSSFNLLYNKRTTQN